MNKRAKEITEVARQVGLVVSGIETTRGNHLRVALVSTDGRTLNYFTAQTPGDHRGLKNMRSDLSRFVRGGAI